MQALAAGKRSLRQVLTNEKLPGGELLRHFGLRPYSARSDAVNTISKLLSDPGGFRKYQADGLLHAQQIDAEMGSGRYALLFKPGVYGTDANPLQMRVGYYTEVAGLGASPAAPTPHRARNGRRTAAARALPG